MKITIKTESPEATRRLGADFGSLLSGPHTILLTGGMGAGKTAVTKGIVEGMASLTMSAVRPIPWLTPMRTGIKRSITLTCTALGTLRSYTKWVLRTT